MELLVMQEKRVRILPKSLEECINDNLKGEYTYSVKDNTINVLKNPH
jgi:hypothetical protein